MIKSSKISLFAGAIIMIASGFLLFIWDAPMLSYCTILIFEVIAVVSIYYAMESRTNNQTLLLSGLVTVNILGLIAFVLNALLLNNSLTAVILFSCVIGLFYTCLFYFAKRSYQANQHYRLIKVDYQRCMLLLDQIMINETSYTDKLLEIKEIFKQLDLTKDYSFDRCQILLTGIKDGELSQDSIQELLDIAKEFETISRQAKLGDI